MKREIKIKQENHEIDFSKIKKVNFVDVENEEIILGVECGDED